MEFNIDEIKSLLDAFEERNMQKMQIKKGECELLLERTPPQSNIISTSPIMNAGHHSQSMPQQQLPHHFPLHDRPPESSSEAESTGRFISSPMVGTFYSSAAPGEDSFVAVGSVVKEGDVVCIVEAMKVMNEVKSTQSGVIKEILVENGHPVEYGTKIFKVN